MQTDHSEFMPFTSGNLIAVMKTNLTRSLGAGENAAKPKTYFELFYTEQILIPHKSLNFRVLLKAF